MFWWTVSFLSCTFLNIRSRVDYRWFVTYEEVYSFLDWSNEQFLDWSSEFINLGLQKIIMRMIRSALQNIFILEFPGFFNREREWFKFSGVSVGFCIMMMTFEINT